MTDEDGEDIYDLTHIGSINPYRYRGYRYDREVSMYYLQSRYYNPEWGRFLNADGMVSTGQGLLSHNMYAYCNNNPVNMKDSTGEFAITSLIITAVVIIGSCIAAQNVATVAKETDWGISSSKTTTKVTPAKIAPEDLPKDQTVYTLRNGNKVEYVGRTNNITATTARHNANTARKNLTLYPDYPNLTYPEARYMEQYLIMKYGTLNRGNPMNNQINGINPRNKLKWDSYEKAALSRFGESLTYVGE